jgi:hypothetical protein
MTSIEFPAILKDNKLNDRNIEFRNALFSLERSLIDESTSAYLVNIYMNSKLAEIREIIFQYLYDRNYHGLKEFFAAAYKKERSLHMKMMALRGLSQFLSESEIEIILQKFNETLKKRLVSIPYNYIEYEFLRGKNLLPWLVKTYGYNCFVETLHQVDEQYDAMPEQFKGHFTIDESGNLRRLRPIEQTKWMIDAFFRNQRNEIKDGE